VRSHLDSAVTSEGLGVFYVDLRVNQLFIHAAPSFIFFTEITFLEYLWNKL